MSNIMPFNFNGKEVRAIEGQDGSAWLLAKDVCECLDLAGPPSQHIRNLDDDEKGVITIHTLGGPQEVSIISESGLYKLTFKSRKPEASKFAKWVTSEVLPTIRRTGSYTTATQTQTSVIPQLEAARAVPAFADAFRALLGTDTNAVAIATNQAVREVYGQDMLALGGVTHLLAESQERTLTPTDIGKFLGVGPIQVNLMLSARGLQGKGADGKWYPTEMGKVYSRLFDTGKRSGYGTPVQQLKWRESVMDVLREAIQ